MTDSSPLRTESTFSPGVVYATRDGVALKGDLYLPAGDGPFPALVLIHGGGWQGGSPASFKTWGPFLAQQGYAAFAISYRLARPGQRAFPESLYDCKAAVQYLRGRANELRINPERIGGMGHSAGAHLVAMLALTAANASFANPYEGPFCDLPAGLKAVVPTCGVYDLIAQWEHDQHARPKDQITERYLGGTPMDLRPTYYEASPLYHASVQNAAGGAWMVTWATADDVVDWRQSTVFAEHLKRAGATVRPAELLGASHFWMGDTAIEQAGSYNAQFAPRLLTFLSVYL